MSSRKRGSISDKRGWACEPTPSGVTCYLEVLAPEEREDRLGRLVGLGQHGRAGLAEDLSLGEGHHLRGHVGVTDAGLRRREVLDGDAEVADGVLEAVLDRTELAALSRHRRDGEVDRRQRRRRGGSG